MRERLRIFERLEKRNFYIRTGAANQKLHQDGAGLKFRLDSKNVSAGRQGVFELHEHLGPVETARFYDVPDKLGAVLKIAVFSLRKKTFQITSLVLQPVHVLLNLSEA